MKAGSMRYDAIILGAGAAGLMCAAVAGRRGLRVVVLDHNDQAGKKILASGGGRCNFTNRDVSAEHYRSSNPHFVKSALARFGPEDICALLTRHRIPFVEEKEGQLFCKRSSRELLQVLLRECRSTATAIVLSCRIQEVEKRSGFTVRTNRGTFEAPSLVVAAGGLSYRNLGASDLGFRIALQFGHSIVAPRPALVPLTWSATDRKRFGALSGISFEGVARTEEHTARGAILLTHRGISGPAILEVSMDWRPGTAIAIDLMPGEDAKTLLQRMKRERPRAELKTALSQHLPRRLAASWCDVFAPSRPFTHYSEKELNAIATLLHSWEILPAGTEGYTAAEVTAGGVDTHELSSKTMGSKRMRGLFFIGEVIDVTGTIGGYNLHWAWASGAAAGHAL